MRFAAVAFVLLVCLVAAGLLAASGGRGRFGGARGADYARSPHVVVDTLNLAHWLDEDLKKVSPEAIVSTVNATAPVLKRRYPGRVMYVLKDRTSEYNTSALRAEYKALADRHNIYIAVAERYVDPPAGVPHSDAHSAQGRDDFYISLLANRWKCAVLTEDRLRDFAEFRATLQPFHVYEFAFWRAIPEREFIRPESPKYARLKKPRMLRFDDVGGLSKLR